MGSGNKAICGNVNVKIRIGLLWGTIKMFPWCTCTVCVLWSWCIHIEVVYLLTICSTHTVCSAFNINTMWLGRAWASPTLVGLHYKDVCVCLLVCMQPYTVKLTHLILFRSLKIFTCTQLQFVTQIFCLIMPCVQGCAFSKFRKYGHTKTTGAHLS